MNNFTKAIIRGVITGFIVGLAVAFVIKEFVSPALNLNGGYCTVIVAIMSAIGAIVIIEINKHSKDKAK